MTIKTPVSERPPGEGPRGQSHRPLRIDPRFARRWIEVRRQQGRRRLHIIVAGAAVVACLAAAAGLLYTPLARVRHVRVVVSGPMTPAQVRAVAGLDRYKLMVDVDAAAIARRLDADPVLGAARVERRWPATVKVAVKVRTPVAVVRSGPEWAIVDSTGRVLAETAQPAPGLPQLTAVGSPPAPGGWLAGSLGPSVGPGLAPGAETQMNAASDDPGVPKGPAAALVALQALPAHYRAEVISVAAPASGALTFSVLPANLAAGSIPVDFGDGSQLAAKLNALITLLAKADLGGVESINLTVPGRPAALTAR
jgi:POTRA domain, FtsQ-type/Cell division protein FtsQ/DivIB, C-terminal